MQCITHMQWKIDCNVSFNSCVSVFPSSLFALRSLPPALWAVFWTCFLEVLFWNTILIGEPRPPPNVFHTCPHCAGLYLSPFNLCARLTLMLKGAIETLNPATSNHIPNIIRTIHGGFFFSSPQNWPLSTRETMCLSASRTLLTAISSNLSDVLCRY